MGRCIVRPVRGKWIDMARGQARLAAWRNLAVRMQKESFVCGTRANDRVATARQAP